MRDMNFSTVVGVRYVNTYSRTQLYLFLLQGVYNNDMFRHCMWAIIRLWLDLQLGCTSMRVVVLGHNGAGSRSHYVTGYHGTGCIWLDIIFFP